MTASGTRKPNEADASTVTTQRKQTVSEIIDAFISFETENALFDVQIKNKRFWDYVRYEVFYEIVHRQHAFSWREKPRERYLRYAKELFYSIILSFKIPRNTCSKVDIFIVSYDRNNVMDGKEVNITFYPVVKAFHDRFKMLYVDPCSLDDRAEKKYSCAILKSRKFHVTDKLKSLQISYAEQEESAAADIGRKLVKRFGIEVDMKTMLRSKFSFELTKYERYCRILEKFMPAVVVFADDGSQKGLIEAAHHFNIPAVDFQHSLVSDVNILYTYPPDIARCSLSTLPDYVFSFGEFWHERFRLPAQKVAVGFPYFEIRRKEVLSVKQNEEHKKSIIIISDQFSKQTYIRISLELSRLLPDYTLLYKLRADDYSRWQERYPPEFVSTPNIRVIDNNEITLYEYFSRSSYQIGVNSTAVYEGLGFGLITFILKEAWYEEMLPLIDGGCAFLVSESSDIAEKIRNNEIPSRMDSIAHIFKENSLKHTEEAIRMVIARGRNTGGVFYGAGEKQLSS